ncbi:WG repeat-containing protein [Psychrobacter sp. FDAARGOS_221]|uniref:WG repeat-containing protein n=1 Tax=Psychrobacter sp. FDAARGOS_221 TaxID=1975705 RepID=UPI000BB53EB5|nr:WG repeat-containing protein [Psychrobacter sp. FDAARGOS_221]PNK60467.1 hypothetical protein A6J60_005975 [Psychrobacter sp. FDAARGOS_221]
MKKFKQLTALTFCSLLIPITASASLDAADCQTVSFDTSEYDELWGCPDTPVDSDFVMIAIKDEKAGAINSKGEIILPVIYDSVQPNSYEKLLDNADPSTIEFKYKGNGVAGVINGLGEVIIPEYSSDNSILGQLMLSKTDDGRSKLTHIKTHQSVIYDHVFPLTLGNDKVPVSNDELWGMVNTDTMQVDIPFIYQQLFFFDDGIGVTKLNGKYGAIDEQNNIIIPFIYKNLTGFDQLSRYPSPVAIATPYDQPNFLVINKKHQKVDTLSKPTPDAIATNVIEDLLAFKRDNGRTGIANWQGKILFEPEVGFEILFIDEEFIHLDESANEIDESEATADNSKLLWYQYDKQQQKLTITEKD